MRPPPARPPPALGGGPRPARPRIGAPCTRGHAARPKLTAAAAPSRGSPAPAPPLPPDRCYGCGEPLQTTAPDALGYVDAAAVAAKAARRQRGMLNCARCRGLAHGGLIVGVAESWMELGGAGGGGPRRLATPADLRLELAGLAASKVLAVAIVDCLDVPGSLLTRVRDLVGANPVFLVGTRADLLPVDAAPLDALASWLADAAARRKLTVAGAVAVSSKTGAGVARAVAALRRERLGRDVVVLGAANVGKSAFVRAMVRDMARATSAQYEPAAASISSRLPTASPVPGTTLGRIPLRAFGDGAHLCDTPGVHLHHRLLHSLAPGEVRALQPTGPLRPLPAPGPAGAGSTYLWGGIARLDVVGAPAGAAISFVGPAALTVASLPLAAGPLPAAATDAAAGGPDSGPAFGRQSADARGGLRAVRTATLVGAAVDVCVSGLPGWIELRAPPGCDLQGTAVTVWAPPGVEAFLRPPVPRVGERTGGV